jgi:hypothetical protein
MRRLDMKVPNPDKHAGRDTPRQLGKKQALESALTVLLEERSVNENSVTSYTYMHRYTNASLNPRRRQAI